MKGGFSHVGISVDDVYAVTERLHKLGVKFEKSPNQGMLKGYAVVLDPDGYKVWIQPKGDFQGANAREIDCLGNKKEAQGGYGNYKK